MSTPIYKRRDKFINKSTAKHGNKYDYSLVEYVDAKTPVTIICPNHGEFKQMPDKHANAGCGCPACGGRPHITTKSFIERAKELHEGKYEYPNTEYTTTYSKVLIHCPKHGEFKQVAKDHLAGCGCLICDGTYKSNRDEFIQKARRVHGDRYNYSPSVYRSTGVKLDIRCKVHGIFKQTPSGHLRGQGCPYCGKLGFFHPNMFNKHPELKDEPCTFYVVKFTNTEEEFVKVGITRRTIKSRFAGYLDYTIKILREESLTLVQAVKLERTILGQIKPYEPNIRFGGWRECVSLSNLPKVNDIVDKKFYLV